MDTDDFADLEIIARTLYGEARGEPLLGRQGVGNVLGKRAKLGWQGETTPRGVCLHHKQFSCWNANDPNREILLGVISNDIYDSCLQLARQVLDGTLSDVTNGADSYHVTGEEVDWSDGLTPTVVIGKHSFYNTRESSV